MARSTRGGGGSFAVSFNETIQRLVLCAASVKDIWIGSGNPEQSSSLLSCVLFTLVADRLLSYVKLSNPVNDGFFLCLSKQHRNVQLLLKHGIYEEKKQRKCSACGVFCWTKLRFCGFGSFCFKHFTPRKAGVTLIRKGPECVGKGKNWVYVGWG